ncbi:dynein regulatory complex protein 10 isoform X1 [Takifugu rubripes]|uniref:dynein regulatory complex protein 10 isoform X1 n=1 Tax=Takifugu rubripes TaxID=31033 RepID=UPI0011453E52|nr:dynein regulatory complex protein 10 isoform X1 [Takifugu rubripes]
MGSPKPVCSDPNDIDFEQDKDQTATMEEVIMMISQRSHGIDHLERSLHKKREEESTLAEQLQAAFEESETMQKKQQQDVDHMNAQLNDLMTSNFEEEAAIRWRIKRVDTVTERLTEDFDEEMEALQESFERVTKEYEQEVEEVERLEMLYSELDVEYRNILENRRLAEEKKEKEAKQLMLMTEAALLIQACWRGYGVRKALKERGKKGKGKKGKKGKGSKGKKKAGKKS